MQEPIALLAMMQELEKGLEQLKKMLEIARNPNHEEDNDGNNDTRNTT